MNKKILKLNKIKSDAEIVANFTISEPNVIHYQDIDQYEIGNLLFCDTFGIIYNLNKEERMNNHFLGTSDDCKYMTVKSGKWNLYNKKEITNWGGTNTYINNKLIMVNDAVDIDGFIFNDFHHTNACCDGCSVQILDISLVWLTPEMIDEIWKLHHHHNNYRDYLQFYKTYPLINTGGDTGISMTCYTYNNEICAIYIE